MFYQLQSDGRRVKSTGDEAAPPQGTQQRSRREEADEASVFFARPVKIRKNRGQARMPLSNRSGKRSHHLKLNCSDFKLNIINLVLISIAAAI